MGHSYRERISQEAIRHMKEKIASFRSLELEIGAGKGRFLIERAKEHRDTLFIAVEIRIKYANIMAGRVQRHSLDNMVVLNDDIRNVFSDILYEEGIFDRVFIHFPDPWWKRRHDRRYLAKEDVVSDVVRILKEGGELFIQTDVFERAREVLGYLSDHPLLGNLEEAGGFVEKNPFHHKTGREQACEDLGLPIFRIHFRKL